MSVYAVVGGRDFKDYPLLCSTLDKLKISKIVSGGAKGADSLAENYAKEKYISLQTILPDWSLGRKAGPLRNIKIVDSSEIVVAFWDGKSPGTKSTIQYAEKVGKRVIIISY